VDDRTLLERTVAVLAAGARGIVYGRNIVQHEDPAGITAALLAVLHEGASVEDGLGILAESAGRASGAGGAARDAGVSA
jgi:hypothetical protein